jgi:microcystin-dependent protein
MADLTVQPAYQFKPTDIVTVDKLNLLGTPVVSLNIETPVTDINFFRNGNFYSAFWTNATGLSCPVGVETINADYWSVNPNGAAVNTLRSTNTPDIYSLWSLEIQGAASVTTCSVGQQINGDLSATMRRPSTFSGYIQNNSGTVLSPTLEIWTANAFNNFSACTLQTTVNLQSVNNGTWGYVNATVDLSTVANAANGIFAKIRLPSGALAATTDTINFSRLKFQLGEVATQFTDDPAQFIQTTSVDSTMLQDGCLARSTLYVTNPGVIPEGAFAPAAIQGADIGVGEIEAINLDPGISTTTTAAFNTPAVNANVAISVTSSAMISAGMELQIAGAGEYQVVTVSGPTVTATNTGLAGNAAPGTIVNSGAAITTTGNAVTGCLGYTPVSKSGDHGVLSVEFDVDTAWGANASASGGVIIATSTTNANNSGYAPVLGFNRPSGTVSTTTAANFTVPAVNATVAITLTSTTNVASGVVLNIAGAGRYQVASVASNVATSTNLGSPGNAAPGTVINSGAAVTAVGNGRAIGLDTTGRFSVIDAAGNAGYLLDSVFQVDTNSYQDASITLQKLAQSLINVVIPPGMVRMFAGPNPPTGWLVCDGTAYPQSSYPNLYAAIGTYWGAGSGGQQFQVPDFRGRSPLGYVNSAVSGITGRAFGSVGGEENHVLAEGELAYHRHSITDVQHTHTATDSGHGHTDSGHTHSCVCGTINTGTSGSGQNIAALVAQTTVGHAAIQTGYASITVANQYTGITETNYDGSNTAHNNMQPFSVLYFIIKT